MFSMVPFQISSVRPALKYLVDWVETAGRMCRSGCDRIENVAKRSNPAGIPQKAANIGLHFMNGKARFGYDVPGCFYQVTR